jgi:hypothetical protein
MEAVLIYAIVTSIFGLSIVIFAKWIGNQIQRFDANVINYLGDGFWAKRWQSFVDLGVGVRVKFFRIGGILLMGEGIFVILLWFYIL